MATSHEAIDARADAIRAQEIAAFEARTRSSKALYDRAETSMPFGVASSFQAGDPYPIYLAEGHGSRVVDIDGNEYIDFHNGFGSMAVGHAHPKVTKAIIDTARS
ncbi:MAG: aminotransferase class III-fold pyridoxal phosphate-dependent enzyme, partial [Actinomycetota bacterium]